MADLSDLATLPAITKFIERCIVTVIPAGSTPKDVTIQLPDADGAKVPARYTGFPPGLAVSDEVSVRATPQDPVKYLIAGTSGATANAAGGWPFANKITVSTTNTDADYSTIASAISGADAGDVILLDAETFTETITIDKSLTIIGSNPESTTITYGGAGHTITITGANVTLENLTIINTSTTASTAAVTPQAADFVIRNCILTSSGHAASNGIYSLATSSGQVIECTITASGASSTGIKDASTVLTVSVIRCTVTGVNADISLSVAGSSVDIQDSTMTKGRINTTSTSTLTGTLDGAILVNNASGALPDRGDVGYLDEAGDYKETMTEGDNVAWCVVEIGNIDGKNIFVRRRGETTVTVTTSPSAGHFLITSTTPGSATHSETMRPEIFAVCTAGESGGTVAVQLLTGTEYKPYTSSNNILWVVNSNVSDFDALINSGGVGGLTATNVPYDAITAGDENVIDPSASGELGKMVLHNLGPGDPGTNRLITGVDTANNAITTVSSTDSWANNDAITIVSRTCFTGGVEFIDINLSQQSEILLLARSLTLGVLKKDTGANDLFTSVHPFETYVSSKESFTSNIGTTQYTETLRNVPLINQIFCVRWQASGAATQSTILRIKGYELAVP